MATTKQMQAQIDALTAQIQTLMAAQGITKPISLEPEERSDHIPHGSDKHRAFLELIIVPEDEINEAKEDGYTILKSRKTSIVYRLGDEISVLRHYPSISPIEARRTVLRQKVGVLESGGPKPYPGAPDLITHSPV